MQNLVIDLGWQWLDTFSKRGGGGGASTRTKFSIKRESSVTDLSVKSRPSKKRERPLLLGKRIDIEIKGHISGQ